MLDDDTTLLEEDTPLTTLPVAPARTSTNSMSEYENWVTEPTPQSMTSLLKSFEPLINSEIQRYNGPKPLLRSRAKSLAISAVKTYDPLSGAQLRSWVTTQLQPLSRYGQSLRPIYAPEVAVRQAAEVNRVSKELSDDLGRAPTDGELADEIGISIKRVRNVRKMVIPAVSEGSMDSSNDSDETSYTAGVSKSDSVGSAEVQVYDSLDARDKRIFDWKTGRKGVTLSNLEIAKRLGVTPALISQRTRTIAEQVQTLARRGGS